MNFQPVLSGEGEAPARASLGVLLPLAGAAFLLHVAFGNRYGFFRDELYYIACGRHLAWGYVDQPPGIAVVARLSGALFGESLRAYRIFPALASAGIVFLTGLLARTMGGGRFAQLLAGLAILLAPAVLAFDSFLSMNAFEPLFWMGAILIALRIFRTGEARWWLAFGAVMGFALLNKNSALAFGVAFAAALLVTHERRWVKNPWLWAGGALAFAIFLPNLVWQARHGWPQWEVVRAAQQLKNVPRSALGFFWQQVLFLHPVLAPVWIAGLVWLLAGRDARRFRMLGWTYVFLFVIFCGLGGKAYYLLPAYAMLVAAGGICFERWLVWRAPAWRAATVAIVVVAGLLTLPYGVPVLPLNMFLRIENVLQLGGQAQTERDWQGPLPQLYADMIGWPEMTDTVARVYDSLPAGERGGCAILTGNYGEAAAIDFFGRAEGLPWAISGHNQYWLWGPRGYSGTCVVSLGVSYQQLEALFGSIEQAAVIEVRYAMPVERNLPVYICREPRAPLAELWPRLRYFE